MRPAFGLAIAVLLVGGLPTAYTASSSVSGGRVGTNGSAITPNTLKPSNCSGITLTARVSGSGTFSGSSAAELVLGSSGVDTISALGGNDCVLGGGGNDSINGGAGTDVCIGGPGTDTFTNCETVIQ